MTEKTDSPAASSGNTAQTPPAAPKPLLYACSGCSDAGELADRVARMLHKQGIAEMSCLAGVAGRVIPLFMKAKQTTRRIVIDGCPLNCARRTFEFAGINPDLHIELQDIGFRKGQCPASHERVAKAAELVAKAVGERVEQER